MACEGYSALISSKWIYAVYMHAPITKKNKYESQTKKDIKISIYTLGP